MTLTQTSRQTTRAILALALALFATIGFVVARDAAAAPTVPAAKGGVYWGAWIGPQLTGTEAPWDMSAVSNMENRLGKGMSLVEFSAPFTNCESVCKPQEFPTVGMNSIQAHGSIPVLSWGSQATGGADESEYQLSRIAAGDFDPYIERFAREAKAWGHPYFLRFDWEMNGSWFEWSAKRNGNDAADFVAAWRHVHDIFESVGATNATWVWCPYANGSRNLGALRSLYPGNAYVNWTCLDGYNWGRHSVNPSPWRSFSFLFGPSYQRIVTKIAPSKPLMLGEIASNGGGRPKAEWIRQMFAELPTRFPKVRGLIWFDRPDRGMSWTLESSPVASQAFAEGVHSTRYRGNVYSDPPPEPIAPPG